MKKKSWSAYVLVAFLVTAALVIRSESTWKEEVKISGWDAGGYHAYLPQWFIYKTTDFTFIDTSSSIYYKSNTFARPYQYKPQLQINKYSSGLAVLQTPAFLIAHVCAKKFGYEANGYSLPYRWFLLINCVVLTFIGLYCLRWVLRQYFTDVAVAFTLTSLILGTNLLYYCTKDYGMTHAYCFALFSMLLYGIKKFLLTNRAYWILIISLLLGLLTAMRITHIVWMILPFLVDIGSLQSFFIRIKFIFTQYKMPLAIGVLLFCLPLIPQIVYFYQTTGQIWVNTYYNERFFWFEPLLNKTFFSFRNGWVIYNPIVLLALMGLIPLWMRHRQQLNFVFIALTWTCYFMASWWCWWYVGYGQRMMVDYYALWAFAMAAFFNWVWVGKRFFIRILVVVFVVITCLINGIHYHQYAKGIIHWDAMTYQAYKTIAFCNKSQITASMRQQRDAALSPPNNEEAIKSAQYRRNLP
ncbi:MAG TPA: hypothetical protein PKD56_02465 [Chitinophagales bacterium]|nr:hypothetical protein [Chitinophagales bacterium]